MDGLTFISSLRVTELVVQWAGFARVGEICEFTFLVIVAISLSLLHV